LLLGGLKCKIKILEIYFDEKCDLSTCAKTRDYNVFLSFYFYLQDNLYLQDKDSHSLLNLIFNQIENSKKKMSLIKILFSTWWNSCTINIDLTSCKREGGNLRGKKKHKKPQEKAITRKTKKKKKRKKGTTREGGGWHSSLCSLPPPPFIDFLSSSSSPVTKNRQSKPSMAFLFLSGLIPRSPPHQTWPPLSAEQTSPTINSIASNWELHPQRWLQSRLAATSSTAPATRCKCKPTAAIEGPFFPFLLV